MSTENRNKLVVLYRHIIREVHRGNFLPLIVTVAVSWFVIMPVYRYVDRAISSNTEFTTDVAMNVYQMQERINELEAKMNESFDKRRPGHVGTTSF